MGTKQMCVSELGGAIGPKAGEAGGGGGELLQQGAALMMEREGGRKMKEGQFQ